MARLPPNKKSKHRQKETRSSNSSLSTSSVATTSKTSNGPAVSHPVSQSTEARSRSNEVPSTTTSPRRTPPSCSHSSISTPRSSPALEGNENDRDRDVTLRTETPRSRELPPSPGHGALPSCSPGSGSPTNPTDETPRSSRGSEEIRRDERRATLPPPFSDGGLSSGEILRHIQDFFQRQEAFNARIEEHLQTSTPTTVDERERRTRRLPKAVTVRFFFSDFSDFI